MVEYDLLGLKVQIPDFNDLTTWIVKPITDFLTQAWNAGGELFKMIADSIRNGLNQFFSAAGDFLTNVQKTITAAFNQFLGEASTFIDQVSSAVYNALVKTAGSVWSQILGVGTDILNALTGFFADTGTSIQTALGGLSAFVGDTWNAVLKSVGELEFTIINAFKFWVGEAAEYIINSVKGAGNAVNQLGGMLTGFFQDLGSTIERNTGSILDAIGYIVPATRAIMLIQNETVQKSITDGFGSIWSGIQDGLLTPLTDAARSAAQSLAIEFEAIFRGAGAIGSGIYDFFKGLWDSITGFISGLINPSKKDIFGDPIGFITKTLGSILGVFGSFGVAATAGEILQPLKNMGFTRLAAYFKDIGDFQRIGGDLITTLQQKSTLIPLEQALNLIFRPYLPDVKTGDQWLFKGIVSTEGWRQIYAARGWSDDLIDKYYSDVWTEPSDRMLIAFAETAGVPDGWLDDKIAARGYDPVDRALFKTYITQRRLSDEFNSLKAAYEAAYIKGYIGYVEYGAILKAIGRNDLEVGWALESATRKADTARLNEDIDIIVQAYRTGKLDDAGLERNIKGLTILPARQENIIEKEIARKKTMAATEKAISRKTLSASQILAAYKAKLIDGADCIKRLIAINYAPDDAALLVAITDAGLDSGA